MTLHRTARLLVLLAPLTCGACTPKETALGVVEAVRELFAVRTQTQSDPPPIPYVVIRHDRPNIVFEDALYTALSRALNRYPDARFDVVLALPPTRPDGDPLSALAVGERQIEEVVWAMTDMGLPADRALYRGAHRCERRCE